MIAFGEFPKWLVRLSAHRATNWRGIVLQPGPNLNIQAVVLHSWHARYRVQVLLEILRRATPTEMDGTHGVFIECRWPGARRF